MEYESKKKFIIDVLFIVTIAAVVYFIVKYMLSWFIPLIVGLMIVAIMQPVSKLISKIVPIKNKGATFFALLFFYIIIGLLMWFGSAAIIGQCSEFISNLPETYETYIAPLLLDFNNWAIDVTGRFAPETAATVSEILNNVLSEMATFVTDFSVNALNAVTGIIKNLPIYLITLVFTIVCSVFISLNYPAVKAFLKKQLPEKGQEMLESLRLFLVGKFAKVIKAYLLIMLITFTENAIGLTILGIKHSIIVAAIIAVCDILPIIGSGTILIPWAIVTLISQNFFVGIGLIVLYGIITVIRNAVEPKIVGTQIGLNPIVTITSMYAGLKIFGFVGFFLGPLTVLFLIQLHNDGYIKIWK